MPRPNLLPSPRDVRISDQPASASEIRCLTLPVRYIRAGERALQSIRDGQASDSPCDLEKSNSR
jgi:hypothetical protein